MSSAEWGAYVIEDEVDDLKQLGVPLHEYRALLYCASVCNSTKIVKWLITEKMNPDDCFIHVDQVDVLRLFIRHSKRLDLAEALESALVFEYSEEYIRTLMFHGARIDPKTRESNPKYVIEWENEFVKAKEDAMIVLVATKGNKRLRDVGKIIARAVWEFY